jgi:hypothetical protein
MPNFEEMGRALDREMERLREIAETRIKPATCGKAASALRSISKSLARLAEQIESKAAAKKTS